MDDEIAILLFSFWSGRADAPSIRFSKTFDGDFAIFGNRTLEHDVVENFCPALAIRYRRIIRRGRQVRRRKDFLDSLPLQGGVPPDKYLEDMTKSE